MKSKFVVLLVVVSLAGACRNDKNLKRGQENYDVVQEGSTTGVTSTISGPGETPPPVTATPLTGTNADTTTNFTLPTTQTDTTGGAMQQPNTIAGTMPAPIPSAAPVARPRMIQSPRLRRTTTTEAGTTMATDTVNVPPETTTQTDTTATSTQPPPDDGQKKHKKKQDDQQQPPPDQPPPPPPTDTTDTAHPPEPE